MNTKYFILHSLILGLVPAAAADLTFDIGGRSLTTGPRTYPNLFGSDESDIATAIISDTVNGMAFNAIFQVRAQSTDSDPTLAYRINASNQTFLRVGSDSGDDAMESAQNDQLSLILLSLDNPLVDFSGFTRIAFGNAAPNELCSINGSPDTPALATGIDLTQPLFNSPNSLTVLATSGVFDIGEITLQFFDRAAPDVTPPTSPASLQASPSDATVNLQWNPVSDNDLASYKLYRRTGNEGPFDLIETIHRPATSFINTGLNNGLLYQFRITSVDTHGNESVPSNTISTTPIGDRIPPGTPTEITAMPGNGTIQLSWTANSEADFSHYLIYRKIGTSNFTLHVTQSSPSFLDTGLVNGEDYQYSITAVDTSSNMSPASSGITASPILPTSIPDTKPHYQSPPYQVTGDRDLLDASGLLFPAYLGFPNLANLPIDFEEDASFLDYHLGTPTIYRLSPSLDSPVFTYNQRISATAHTIISWSEDLLNWPQSDLTEISRMISADRQSEEITLRFDHPDLKDIPHVYARITVHQHDFQASFSTPPTARHGSAISMIAREAAFDPRTVEYFFEATSSAGNDSGWQRDRLYIDAGQRPGDSPIVPGTICTYRVKTRQIDPLTGTPTGSQVRISPAVSATIPDSPNLAANRPNIILIMCDDLGHEAFNIYGSTDHNTPRITEMANEGIRFTNFHSQPLCSPSRVAIMSGRSNHRNYTRFDEMLQNTTFGNFFQNAGYRTAIAGKWQLDGGSLNGISRMDPRIPHWMGFDQYLLWHFATTINNVQTGERYWDPDFLMTIPGTHTNRLDPNIPAPVRLTTNRQWNSTSPGNAISSNDYGPDMVNTFVNDFITQSIDESAPFFVYYPMILPHDPWPNPPTITDTDAPGTRSSTGDSKKAMSEYMDHLVGKTWDLIKSHPDPKISKNTLVIFTSDNGTNRNIVTRFREADYRGAKRETRDAGHHVPFVAWWGGENGRIPTGRISHDLISIYDILATLCDAAGTPLYRPPSVTGGSHVEYIHDSRSFLSALQEQNRDPRSCLYQRWRFKDSNLEAAWAYNAQYKLYRDNPTDGPDSVVDNMDRSGRFFNTLNTPLERVPNTKLGGSNSMDDSITPATGSRLEALREEFQAFIDLMESDKESDSW
jgi:arylsulfatase A-like enzyme/chitodextrinase